MNRQARIDPWPSWLGTYLQLIPSHTILVSEPPTAAAAAQPRAEPPSQHHKFFFSEQV
jgi:hypothetical protein